MCRKRDPQSVQGPPGPQPARIRNPPCGKCKIASGIRSSNCAGPGTASKRVPEAPEGCVLRHFLRRSRIRPRER
eukprot:4642213-Alexandrium_andersonii.AAC.1